MAWLEPSVGPLGEETGGQVVKTPACVLQPKMYSAGCEIEKKKKFGKCFISS